MEWNSFAYHPDLADDASFTVSFSHLAEYAQTEDYKSTVVEEFQFYPYEYNFTEFEFDGFDDEYYEVIIDLTHGGEFPDIDLVKPFGMSVQTPEGERYLDSNYFSLWQHEVGLPIYHFSLSAYDFREIDILEGSDVLVTYRYPKESLSYYATHDDILFDPDTFIIKDELGLEIALLGNLLSVEGNNITFTDNMKSELAIKEEFTIEMEVKTKFKILDMVLVLTFVCELMVLIGILITLW